LFGSCQREQSKPDQLGERKDPHSYLELPNPRHLLPPDARRFGRKKQQGMPLDSQAASEVNYCFMEALKYMEEDCEQRTTNVRLNEGTGSATASRTTRTGAENHEQRVPAHSLHMFVRYLNRAIAKRRGEKNWDESFPVLGLPAFLYLQGYGQNQEMDLDDFDPFPEPLNFESLKVGWNKTVKCYLWTQSHPSS
jgi:hypothetical protein